MSPAASAASTPSQAPAPRVPKPKLNPAQELEPNPKAEPGHAAKLRPHHAPKPAPDHSPAPVRDYAPTLIPAPVPAPTAPTTNTANVIQVTDPAPDTPPSNTATPLTPHSVTPHHASTPDPALLHSTPTPPLPLPPPLVPPLLALTRPHPHTPHPHLTMPPNHFTTPTHLVGHTAPGFTLPDQHGSDRSLSEPRIRRPTLLVFYPFAFSRVCGGELRELQSALPEFTEHNTDLLAISCDPMYALRVYAEQEDFAFPLLSDFWPHGAVARAYGVFDEVRGCARRGSFLIDQDGIVRWSVVNPISEARPLADYLSALTQLTPPAERE